MLIIMVSVDPNVVWFHVPFPEYELCSLVHDIRLRS